MRKKGCIYGYWYRLILLVLLVLGPGPAVITGSELSPDFELDILELAFTDGKYYRVTPLKSRGPAYFTRMKARGRGTLKGKWLVDDQVIGLFEVFLHANDTVDLRGHRVPRLPTNDLGPHELTLAFSNYEFPKPIPIIRYFVAAGGAILIQAPEPGSKVPVPPTDRPPLQLQWDWDDTGKRKQPVYQVLISETPLRFLTEDQMADMWKEVGRTNQYTLDLSPFRVKRKKWIYWQVRALKPSGDPLTISEISSFKLVKKKSK
jgi:hypothetical protein